MLNWGLKYFFLFYIKYLHFAAFLNGGCYQDCKDGRLLEHANEYDYALTADKCKKFCFDEKKFLFGKLREGGGKAN